MAARAPASTTTDAKQTWHRYRRSIDALTQGIRVGGRALDLSPLDRLPGLTQALGSISSCAQPSFEGRGLQREEWNPLSQRPSLPRGSPRGDAEDRFSLIAQAVEKVVILAHEAMHVLLWEPFFAGRIGRLTETDFTAYSLAFEGYCFFYADIVVTPLLRERFPDGELVLSRSAVSSPYFHPYRVFKALGITDRTQILRTYVQAFGGYETPLVTRRVSSPLVHDFARRAYRFHASHRRDSRRLYRALRHMGLFAGLAERFCRVEGIPSLLGEDLLDTLQESGSLAFCQGLHERGMRRLARAPSAHLQRVRLRRALQTRAYFAFQLRTVLVERLYVPAASLSCRQAAIVTTIDRYLDRLERALGMLTAHVATREIQSAQQQSDRLFSRDVRGPLLAAKAWVGRRELIHPRRELARLDVLACGSEGRGDEQAYLSLVQRLLGMANPRHLDGPARRMPSVLLRPLIDGALARGQDEAASCAFTGALREALAEPALLETWSVPLSAIDPLHNRFRDLTFVYE
jgi:hypothetical protein